VPGGARDLEGTRVVLGVTGGIAAYKAAVVARLLVRAGAAVDVVLTHGATNLVGGATFAGITGRPTFTDVWERPETVPHIALARGAAAVVVAPATAHLLAKAAHGLADDLLTSVLLGATCPVVLAPAMHTEMWEHPATRANAATLRSRGVQLVGPATGELAGGDVGEGRLADPEEVVAAVRAVAGRRDLAGRVVVVTAGGTREHLDPVRYLGNRSSGRMGYAIAAEAARRGGTVHLVTGPVQLPTPAGVHRHDVVSAQDMQSAVVDLAGDADVVVKAAAVADFRPKAASEQKMKKAAGTPEVVLEANPDILAGLGARRARDAADRPILVGFAAETQEPEAQGREKLERKGADLMVVNDVGASDAGFEVETNRVVMLGRDGRRVEVPLTSKAEVAARLWDEIVALLA
jgi:phosphopantothenoylcysteine decarboxylase/phosphopantothenate--cysteine ligase